RDTPLAARVALWGGREMAGLVLASVVAGLATTPYAAYHFHRLAPYGVLANLGAMPVVSAIVMPAGILGVVAIPFGFDAPCWAVMGWGIDWMIGVVLWVAPRPDVLISADGDTAAIRGPDGRLALLHNGRDTFAVKEWLAADADGRQPKDASLATGTRCDAAGCIGVLANGRL